MVEPFFGGLGAEPTETESGAGGSSLIVGLALAGAVALIVWWALA